MKPLALASVLILLAAPAWAQTAGDARWSTWMGCWDLVTEELREEPPEPASPVDGALGPRARAPMLPESAPDRPRLCVAPAPDGGVTLRTMVDGRTAIEQTIVADGLDRPIDDADCRGTYRAEWSTNGRRLFARAELACAGEAPRSVSGLTLFAPDNSWLDIQAVRMDGAESILVRRYRRAQERPSSPGSSMAGSPLSLSEVKEASALVSPRAVEAALVETRAGFNLTSRSLIDLADAGVPASLIDVIVALSYPQRFIVERRAAAGPPLAPLGAGVLGNPLWPYFAGDSFYYSPYAYTPFGYSSLGRYSSWGAVPGVIVVDGGTIPAGVRASGTGRVINDAGYTRVRPREAMPDTPGNAAATTTSRGAPSAVTSSNPGSSRSSGGSGGGAVSGQGYSSGGSGSSDSGRTAVPR